MIYYLENSGRLLLEGGDSIPFCPGRLILVPPNLSHGSMAKCGFFVNISVIDDDFPAERFGIDSVTTADDNCGRDLHHLFSMIYRYSLEDDCYGKMRNAINCIYDLCEERLRANGGAAGVAEPVKRYLQEHYMESGCTVGKAIRESGYSQSYMREQFSACYGISPQDYLVDLRMETSRVLLEKYGRNLSVAEVAVRCGYEEPLYFSKVFRKRFGVSPGKYRRG